MKLFQIYGSLPLPKANNELVFSASPIKGFRNHRIAKDILGSPCLLIQVSDEYEYHKNIVNQKLYNLDIKHNLECKVLNEKGIQRKAIYTVLRFTGEQELKEHFINVSEILIQSIGEKPTVIDLKKAINKFIELFRVLNEPPKKSIQGLWAELFVIYCSKEPKKMIEAWHNLPEEKFDFNLDKERIEVKSVSSRVRTHHFSLEQLSPPPNVDVFVVSLFVQEITGGVGVTEMVMKITKKIKSFPTLIEKLNMVVFATLGSDMSKIRDSFFDFELAKESLKVFNSSHIPSINPQLIPTEISNVKFRVSLENVPESKSTLFYS